MNCMHENEVNKIAKCNLLHDLLNPSKPTKNINSHYSLIINGFMNTQKIRVKFKNFRILLYSGCSDTIIMESLIQNLILNNMLRYNIKYKQVTLLPI